MVIPFESEASSLRIQKKTVSKIISVKDEYPIAPCKVKGPFEEPIIIRAVAVISRISPMLWKSRMLLFSLLSL